MIETNTTPSPNQKHAGWTEAKTQEDWDNFWNEEEVEEETKPQPKTFSYDGWIPLNKLYDK